MQCDGADAGDIFDGVMFVCSRERASGRPSDYNGKHCQAKLALHCYHWLSDDNGTDGGCIQVAGV